MHIQGMFRLVNLARIIQFLLVINKHVPTQFAHKHVTWLIIQCSIDKNLAEL